MKIIALSDFELNLIHGLLADEEIRLKKPIRFFQVMKIYLKTPKNI